MHNKRNMWFEALWKVKRDNKYIFWLLAAWRALSSLLSTSVAIVSCWSLGLCERWLLLPASKNVSGMQSQIAPRSVGHMNYLGRQQIESHLCSHQIVTFSIWHIYDIYDVHMYNWETKKLILWNTGSIVSSMKCSWVNNILTSNSSGSGFRVPGLDYGSARSIIVMSLSLLLSSFIVSTQGNCC